jgi:hypothetical protein
MSPIDELVKRIRLPPQMSFLGPPYWVTNQDALAISILGHWPDATRDDNTIQTSTSIVIPGTLLHQLPETIPYILEMIYVRVCELWMHELKEWFTVDGVPLHPPHTADGGFA